VDGVLLIDKPAGMSSHDVVAAVRRALGGVRTGHAGTLDPFATGLLLVLVGRATKAQSVFMGLPKRYHTVARLGAVSSTGDTEGQITITGRVPADPPRLPTGEVRQRPPTHSAIKLGGERAYRRARRGEQLVMPERVVTVHRFEQLWREAPAGPGGEPPAGARAADAREHAAVAGELPRAAFAIECGSGTYVRSLIADLGDGYCLELRRTAIGPFDVRDAIAPPPPRTAGGAAAAASAGGPPWAEPPLIALADALARVGPAGRARAGEPGDERARAARRQ